MKEFINYIYNHISKKYRCSYLADFFGMSPRQTPTKHSEILLEIYQYLNMSRSSLKTQKKHRTVTWIVGGAW